MNLWSTREQALKALAVELRPQAAVLEEGVVCLDECITRLSAIDSSFARVCSLLLLKSRGMVLAMYSLTLDGLAQEGGAILRPLIGYIEKLAYCRTDPSHVERAVEGNLPTEGKIAQVIKGKYKFLRDYLSQHASHSEISSEAMGHLVDLESGVLRLGQPYNETVLRKNLEMTFAFLIQAVVEGLRCLCMAEGPDDGFASYVRDVRDRGLALIPVD